MPGPTKAGRYRHADYIVTRSGDLDIPAGELAQARGIRRPVAVELARRWAREGWEVKLSKRIEGSVKTEQVAHALPYAKRLSWLH